MLRLHLLCPAMAVIMGLVSAAPAVAAFHLMQIEQVVGGVNGDATAQAIQLRLRGADEHFVSSARLRAHDAAGANPILLIDIATDLTGPSQLGDRILLATSAFASQLSASAQPDFIMTNPIPSSYLAAGSLTFEDDFGTIYWRLSWGGAGYTGSTAGNATNGTFPNPWPGALPSTGERCVALRFTGAAGDASSSNAAQYALTDGGALWTNFSDQSTPCIPTVSQWGLISLGLLTVIAGTVVVRRHHAQVIGS